MSDSREDKAIEFYRSLEPEDGYVTEGCQLLFGQFCAQAGHCALAQQQIQQAMEGGWHADGTPGGPFNFKQIVRTLGEQSAQMALDPEYQCPNAHLQGPLGELILRYAAANGLLLPDSPPATAGTGNPSDQS